jgi:HEAT repeat protein
MIEKLQPNHRIVLRTLEASNIAFRRVVTLAEIVNALLSDDIEILNKTYTNSLQKSIANILNTLQSRGLVFSPGKSGGCRFYGSVRVLDPQKAELPTEQSRRRRVFELVCKAVKAIGRGVRTGDILEYKSMHPGACDFANLSDDVIAHDVLSLEKTGEIKVLCIIRGDEKGHKLYLPSKLAPEGYMPTSPLTWLEQVARSFQEIWDERSSQAAANNRRPRPISTGEVRARLAVSSPPHPNLKNPKLIVNAMQQLSRSAREIPPLIRRIKRKGQKAMLWVTVDVPDKDLDIGDAYASDAERIGVALKRAVIKLGRPVTLEDVEDEVEMDPFLQPAGNSSLFEILSDASKETIDAGNRSRRRRVIRRVYRVGKVDENTYYYHSPKGIAEARSYVRLRQIDSRWSKLSLGARLEALEHCSLPPFCIGRALLIKAEASDILHDLDHLLESHIDGATKREAESLRQYAANTVKEAQDWCDSTPKQNLPSDISRVVPGWTAEELLDVLKPLYPCAQKIERPNKLVTLLYNRIRRIPNSHYVTRFSKSPRQAAEYLFDRTDALLYAAIKWGGHECCHQALQACDLIEYLRDVRFVLPVLESVSIEHRLLGVACLAFLWSDEGNERLRKLITEDPEPGVRQSALWAYGFAGGDEAIEVFRERERNDRNLRVRKYAKEVLDLSNRSWWRM